MAGTPERSRRQLSAGATGAVMENLVVLVSGKASHRHSYFSWDLEDEERASHTESSGQERRRLWLWIPAAQCLRIKYVNASVHCRC